MDRKKGNKKMQVILLIFLLIGCLIGAYYIYQNKADEKERLDRASGAEAGILPGLTEEELQAELNRRVEEGNLAISINTQLTFPSGTEMGNVRIENSAKNHYLMVVEMYRKDNNERIYKSGTIEPGYYLAQDKLEKDLLKGKYEVNVHFKAYDTKTEDFVGESVIGTTIEVLN